MEAPSGIQTGNPNRVPGPDRDRPAGVPDRCREDRGIAWQCSTLIMATPFNLLSLGYAAGALTVLSPCVLPLVPIVLGSAAQESRWGPFALAAGLVMSFTSVALAVALAGVS